MIVIIDLVAARAATQCLLQWDACGQPLNALTIGYQEAATTVARDVNFVFLRVIRLSRKVDALISP